MNQRNYQKELDRLIEQKESGGMKTKISAAEIATSAGIDCCIMSGDSPKDLYKLFENNKPGTIFRANKAK